NGEYITDGAIALAMQVYVNQHIFLDEDILFPYYCDPKVEIGRFQNTAIEVNQDYIDKHSIQVVRRDTGGGAVYVDKGAVNMCCILEQDTSIYGDFQRFYQPAIKA
ncbi:lipoate--protein ligase, partial [Staphylococcus aureus]|nr:lipoate--protein ligase [Staphylococcus aureus]